MKVGVHHPGLEARGNTASSALEGRVIYSELDEAEISSEFVDSILFSLTAVFSCFLVLSGDPVFPYHVTSWIRNLSFYCQ